MMTGMRRVFLLVAAALVAPAPAVAAIERLPVVTSSGAAHTTLVAPSTGSRYVMAPCWDARNRLITVTEGPPAMIERRSIGRSPRRTRLKVRPQDGALSPTCGLLAELRGDGVWVRSRAGAAARVLPVTGAWESRPQLRWSRDESRLVVVNRETQTITVLAADTGRAIASVTVGEPHTVIDVGAQGVNADASAVLVTTGHADGSSEVQLIDVPAARVIPLFSQARDGAFSPDGRRVAASRRAAIIVSDRRGHVLQRLFDRREYRRGPAWSPDGRRLAFAYSVQHSNGIDGIDGVDGIAVAPARTHGRVSRRYSRRNWFTSTLTWSRDSKHVAVTGFSLEAE